MGNDVQKPLTQEELKTREIQRVDREMRRKMGRGGLHYNMRIVIKGDRNTGKTCLLNRLQALPFSDAYIPSDSIQSAKINWENKNLDDTVIVEVWDVVDVGKAKRKISSGLLTTHGSNGIYDEDETDAHEELNKNLKSFDVERLAKEGHHKFSVLDASLIDVYKGTNAVLLIFDITKRWTFEYIKDEIQKIPEHIDFVVLANYFDLSAKRVVTDEEMEQFKKSSKRKVRIIPTSMKNCYGLKQLHTYLQLPFLKLKIEETKKQLLKYEEDYSVTSTEIDMIIKEQNYDSHVKWMKETKSKPQVFDQTPKVIKQVSTPKPNATPATPTAKEPQNGSMSKPQIKIEPTKVEEEKYVSDEEDTQASLNITTHVSAQNLDGGLTSSDDETEKKKKNKPKEVDFKPIVLDEKIDDFFGDAVDNKKLIAKDAEVDLDKGFYDDDEEDEEDEEPSKEVLMKDETKIVVDDVKISDDEEEEEIVGRESNVSLDKLPTKETLKKDEDFYKDDEEDEEEEEEEEEEVPVKPTPVVVKKEPVVEVKKEPEQTTPSNPFILKKKAPVVETPPQIVQTKEEEPKLRSEMFDDDEEEEEPKKKENLDDDDFFYDSDEKKKEDEKKKKKKKKEGSSPNTASEEKKKKKKKDDGAVAEEKKKKKKKDVEGSETPEGDKKKKKKKKKDDVEVGNYESL